VTVEVSGELQVFRIRKRISVTVHVSVVRLNGSAGVEEKNKLGQLSQQEAKKENNVKI
jgi:hypothetical protein